MGKTTRNPRSTCPSTGRGKKRTVHPAFASQEERATPVRRGTQTRVASRGFANRLVPEHPAQTTATESPSSREVRHVSGTPPKPQFIGPPSPLVEPVELNKPRTKRFQMLNVSMPTLATPEAPEPSTPPDKRPTLPGSGMHVLRDLPHVEGHPLFPGLPQDMSLEVIQETAG